jgi:signal transduction histidine kinase
LKVLILFIPLLFLSFLSFSQDKRRPFQELIENTTDPEIKLTTLDSLISISWEENDLEAYVIYIENYITLAKFLKKYNEVAKKAMAVSYPLSTFLNDPQKAISIIDDALLYEANLTNSYLLGGLYLKRGGAYFNSNLNLALADYTTALKNFTEKDSIYIADTYLFRGQVFSGLGKFVEASEDFKNAYNIYKQRKDTEYMINAQEGEIIMYSKNGFQEKAIKQRKALLRNLYENKLYLYLSGQHYNLSLDYKKIARPDLRKAELEKALKYIDSSNYISQNYVFIHSGFSEMYSLQKNRVKAAYHLNIAEEKFKEISKDNYSKLVLLIARYNYQKELKEYKKALENAIELENILTEIGLEEELVQNNLRLSEIFTLLGDSKKAFSYYKTYSESKDSLFKQSKTNALLYYQTLYETERKEKDLIEKKGEIVLLEQNNASIKKQYLYGGVALTMGFLLLFLFKNQRDLKLKKVLNEKYTQDLLQAQEEERKRVSKDLHDGIGQSLLLIKNKVVLHRDEDTKKMVENAIEEVRAISRALHPFQLQEVGITKAVQNILRQFDETTDLFISTDIDSIDGLLQIHQEVNVYRIVQESLNNVLKHAKASAIKISVKKMPASIELVIQDNGIGFDFSERYNDFKSMGLKTLKERTRFLNGIMKINSQTNKGTKLEFIIPLTHEK